MTSHPSMTTETLSAGMTPGHGTLTTAPVRTHRHRINGRFPVAIILSLTLCAANLWGINKGILGLFHDDGIYTVVAKSLSEGSGHRIISLPSSPPQSKYPFVYSYILSWIWSLNPSFPDNILLLKAVNVFFLFAVLLLSYLFYCKNTEKPGMDAMLYIFLVGGNVVVFPFGVYPLSEVLFLALTLLALVLCSHRGHTLLSSVRIAVLAVIVGLAYLTRTAGAPLILAGLLHLVISRRRRGLFIFLSILSVLIFPWILWKISQAHNMPKSPLLFYYVTYDYSSLAFFSVWSDPAQAMQIVWGNLLYIIESINLVFLLDILPILKFLVYPFIICGTYISLRRHTVFFYSFLLLYLLLILAWPWHPSRFIMPLIPLALLFLFRGIQAVESVTAERTVSLHTKQLIALLMRFPILAILVLNLAWMSFYLQDFEKETTRAWFGQRLPYSWDGFMETFSWIREHTNEEDVLATAYDPVYYLYTRRKAIRPWFYNPQTYFYPYGKPAADLGSVQEIRKELTVLGIRYLIIDPLDGYAEKKAAAKLFDELLASYPVQPELVFTSTDGLHKVYSLPLTGDFRHDGNSH
jgi:hypothetical protein